MKKRAAVLSSSSSKKVLPVARSPVPGTSARPGRMPPFTQVDRTWPHCTQSAVDNKASSNGNVWRGDSEEQRCAFDPPCMHMHATVRWPRTLTHARVADHTPSRVGIRWQCSSAACCSWLSVVRRSPDGDLVLQD